MIYYDKFYKLIFNESLKNKLDIYSLYFEIRQLYLLHISL